jgi:hypothetical protein
VSVVEVNVVAPVVAIGVSVTMQSSDRKRTPGDVPLPQHDGGATPRRHQLVPVDGRRPHAGEPGRVVQSVSPASTRNGAGHSVGCRASGIRDRRKARKYRVFRRSPYGRRCPVQQEGDS